MTRERVLKNVRRIERLEGILKIIDNKIMPYFVYILYSQKDYKLYVGCTSNLENRIKKHNSGGVLATRKRTPLVIIYSEKFQNKAEAFNRERFFKSLWSGKLKRKILKEYLDKIGHN